ncbi:MAG: DUF58 domain-containing protein [Chloroflexi bacterium]|nr:DUF58 domain-containing protein [Chloroflexota bacterium]
MRGTRLIGGSIVLAVLALATGSLVLTFLAWLAILVLVATWAMTRLAVRGLEAGYAVDRRMAAVGERLTISYTVRDRGRLPRLWLEVHSPTTLPVRIPGHALSLRPGRQESWSVGVPLTRRGHHRIDAAVIRTGDPLGLFEAYATVGASTAIVVAPRVEVLPRLVLPAAMTQGTAARPERTAHTTPLVSGIRPYVPGDSVNRIHWPSTARHGEIQVKEFEIQQTADLWLCLDLDQAVHLGVGDTATIETAARVAASIGAHALGAGRSLSLAAAGTRRAVLPADRGPRQLQRLLHLLAGVGPDGRLPLLEVLLGTAPRMRRGTTVVVVTPSIEPSWVGALADLRARGMGTLACIIDPLSHEAQSRSILEAVELQPEVAEAWSRDVRQIRHALAEHDIPSLVVDPIRSLAEQLRLDVRGREGRAA